MHGGETHRPKSQGQDMQPVIESLVGHAALLDHAGNVIAVNSDWKGFARENGFDGAEFGIGSNYLAVCAAATGEDALDAQDVITGISDIIAGKRDSYQREYPCHAPGEQRWFKCLIKTVSADPNPTADLATGTDPTNSGFASDIGNRHILVQHVDVTEQVTSKLALQDWQERVLSVSDRVGVYWYDIDIEADTIVISYPLKRRLSLQNNTFSLRAWSGFIHPEDRDLFGEAIASADGENSTTISLDFRFARTNHPTEWVSTHLTRTPTHPRHDGMKISGILLFRSQTGPAVPSIPSRAERQHQLLDMLPNPVALFSSSLQIRYANEAFRTQFRLSEMSYVGLAASIAFGSQSWEKLSPLFAEALAEAGPSENDCELILNDGGKHDLNSIVIPYFDKLGNTDGFLMVMHDLGELKRIQNALLSEKAKSEQANKAKSYFLSSMSHELRTPLNAILGYSEIMSTGILGTLSHEKYESYSADIHRSAQYLLSIIDQILELTRIERGELDLPLEGVRLDTVFQEALSISGTEISRMVTLDIDQDLWVLANRRGLLQVIINVLNNARKYAGTEAKVSITVRDLSGNGQPNVIISIKDDGPGISKQHLNRVKEPFYRGRSENTKAYADGLGLGLALSNQLITAMHGQLTLESEPNQGLTVHIQLRKAA